ncbi:hypothetical protein M501DRAFT_932556 [Patellaria atrata CBS 101060]|uniref:Sde2 N-terminal ubiquitin domain-containing protein n=1 Tax=Patellaria atrata CBS 101060 TaxID=1346257 RepID=A0A9P4SDD8_9PEZI|nr:hypothetical protein M501DRAFT_932556 [Patellaria atrata CBS 101060]
MASKTVNILFTSFPGLGLPPTLSLPISSSSTVSDLTELLHERIPAINYRLLITTNSNKLLPESSTTPISSLLTSENDTFLPLRLSVPLCGGKGGFGSQLRAAGGRMSSRKKKSRGDENGSSRNLDGRRLRTVTEAKALAEYLAVKPEMDRKEKEERRKRWEQVLEMAERKEEEIKSGGAKTRLDGRWVEAKEDAENKTRDAVLAALKAGVIGSNLATIGSDKSSTPSGESEGSDSEMEEDAAESSTKPTLSQRRVPTRTFFGWEEDEDMNEDDSEDDEDAIPPTPEGKGKGRVST